MNTAMVISAAFPGNWRAAKHIARALDIRERQAKRIIVTERIPTRLDEPACTYLEEVIQRRKAELGEAENELRLARYRRLVARTQGRMASIEASVRRVAPEAPTEAQLEFPFVKD